MVDAKDYLDRIVNERFDVIEDRLRTSFQLISEDIDKIKEKVMQISINEDNKIKDLKEKLTIKFSEIRQEVSDIKEAAITRSVLEEENKAIETKIDRFRKEATKAGIKEDIIAKIKEKFKELQEELESNSKKEINSLKSQITLLKGRVNVLQQSLKQEETKDNVELEKKNKKLIYKETKLKKLPKEDLKYNKNGVKPNFISKIVDSLSE